MSTLWSILSALAIGAVAGWLAGLIMGDKQGLLRNIIVGVVGSAVGTVIFRAVGFHAYGTLAQIVIAVVGACLFIFVGRKLFH